MKKLLLVVAMLVGCLASKMMANETKWLLDSILTDTKYPQEQNKILFTYDTRGNELTKHQFKRENADEEWKDDLLLERTYNDNNQLITEISTLWNRYSEGKTEVKHEWTYNAQGNLQIYTEYHWNLTTWEPTEQTEYEYDEQNHLKTETTSQRVSESNSWRPTTRKKYSSYNDRGQYQLLEIMKKDQQDNWCNARKENYTYSSGNDSWDELLVYFWDATIPDWKNTIKYEQTFDAQGNRLSHTYMDKYVSSDPWSNRERHEYTYDEEGHLTSENYLEWRDGDWRSSDLTYKVVYSYDENGNQVRMDGYGWSETTQSMSFLNSVYDYFYSEHIIDGIEQISNDQSQMTNKILMDGHLYILRDGKIFNAQGARVK